MLARLLALVGRATSVGRQLSILALAGSLATVSSSRADPIPIVTTLGPAGPGFYTVLGLGGTGGGQGTVFEISSPSLITGNVGLAATGNINDSGQAAITGTVFLNSAAIPQITSSSPPAGGVVQGPGTDAQLQQAVASALAASTAFAKLPATSSLTSINSSGSPVTLTGSVGNNVYNLTGLALSGGSSLTLSGPKGAQFIINDSGVFALSGNSSISLKGGLTPANVVFNLTGPGPNLELSGKAPVSGIFLAPERTINNSGGFITGEVIAGGPQIHVSSNGQINGVPEPSTLVLAVSGLCGILIVWLKQAILS